jgi:hypothetical protein
VQKQKWAAEKSKTEPREAFGGDHPMTWVEEEEPMFWDLMDMYERERKKKPEDKPARPHGSRHATGIGYFFPTELFDRYMRMRLPS